MIYRPARRILRTTLVLMIAAILLSGCNTMEGLGKDIQSAGQMLEKTAGRDD